jgi:hypothetical protein
MLIEMKKFFYEINIKLIFFLFQIKIINFIFTKINFQNFFIKKKNYIIIVGSRGKFDCLKSDVSTL